ncbi:hypothetical protein [Compostibacter hankyongensis]|uniref:Shufflon system plasmid conjugative transfer pilus tip adhesin PilV n=1 Tax=Compostibacter hankyongensis TaxID=1007089 RepID=A0ABP8FZX2_9BACT
MKPLFTLLILLISGREILAQNLVPDSGNVGIGTLTPAGNLDVYNAYYTHGYKFMDIRMSNPSVGFLNPIALALRQGKKLLMDEEFALGMNGIIVYDNAHSGKVTITRTDTISDLPNNSGYGLEIRHNGTGESPGYGGFVQTVFSAMNKTLIQIFRAKLPAGYEFIYNNNSMGTGGGNYWLSSSKGTGRWEWYIRVMQCGNGGSFSTTGHMHVTGSPAPTAAAPLIWYMASCTTFDATNLNGYSGDHILNQTAVAQTASLRIAGKGIFGDKVLIGKATQTNADYKLDVNGNVRANKVVVNTTGADFVFDSTYHLPSLKEVKHYIEMNGHLPDVRSAKTMRNEGVDLGQNQMKLLQKIEELTLYMIAQDKKISEQQKLIRQLSARLNAPKEVINR